MLSFEDDDWWYWYDCPVALYCGARKYPRLLFLGVVVGANVPTQFVGVAVAIAVAGVVVVDGEKRGVEDLPYGWMASEWTEVGLVGLVVAVIAGGGHCIKET